MEQGNYGLIFLPKYISHVSFILIYLWK